MNQRWLPKWWGWVATGLVIVTSACGSSDPTLPAARQRPSVATGGELVDEPGSVTTDSGLHGNLDGGADTGAPQDPPEGRVDARLQDAGAPRDAARAPDTLPPPPTCSAQTCKGCCREGVCEPGSAVDACGTSGNACAACPSAFMCTSKGECRPNIDPKAEFRVQPVQTTVATTPPTGAWDPGDDKTPDVIVTIDCRKGGSGVVDAADDKPKFEFDARTGESSSLMPMWSTLEWGDCTLPARELMEAPLRFRVFDNDSGFWGLVSEKDAITPVLTHQVTESDLAYGGFSLPSAGLLTQPLEVRLVTK